jgi:putative ABC transport system substrate-binding protein
MAAKAMEVFKEVLPHAARFGILFSPKAPSQVPMLHAAESVGAKLRIALHKESVQSVREFDGAFAAMARERVDGVMVHGASLTGTHTERLAELTLKHRLPSMFTICDNARQAGS